MGKGSGRYGNKIWLEASGNGIALVYRKNNYSTPTKIPLLAGEAHKMRPTKFLRSLIDVMYNHDLLKSRAIKVLMVHGLDKGYWRFEEYFKQPDEEKADGIEI